MALGLAASRRYEAAEWLNKMVEVAEGKNFPTHPTEEEFRVGLRSGIVLCNILNKIQPGAVPKVSLLLFFFPQNLSFTLASSMFT